MGAPRASRRPPDKRCRLLVLVSAVILVDASFFNALAPLLPHYVHHYGFTKAEVGVLVGAYALGTLLGSLPAGLAASRIGVRPVVLAGLAAMSIATLVFAFATTVPVLDSSRFVQGLGGACMWAGGLAWITSVTPPERRGGALGAVYGVIFAGSLLGPVVGAIASRVGTGPTFAAAGVLGFTLMIWALFFPVPPHAEAQRLRDVLPALRDPMVIGGIWLTFLAAAAEGVIYVLPPLRLNALGAGPIAIGVTFLAAAALSAAVSPLIGRMIDRHGRRRPVSICLGTTAVVALLAPVIAPAGLLALLLVFGYCALGTLVIPALSLISTGADRWHIHQGLGFGLTGVAWAAGLGCGSSGSGAIAQATSDLVPYVLLAVGCGITLLVGPRAASRMATRLS